MCIDMFWSCACDLAIFGIKTGMTGISALTAVKDDIAFQSGWLYELSISLEP